jgi:hypothetical protein
MRNRNRQNTSGYRYGEPESSIPSFSSAARIRGRMLLAFALFTPALAGSAPASPLARNVGFYHWGGGHATSMNQGVEQMAKLGAQAARVTLSPRYYSDYNIHPGCYPAFSLLTIAHEPECEKGVG